jgi:hypothetical protein
MAFTARIDKCKQCGGEYLRKGSVGVYCSEACKEVAKHGEERECLQCSKALGRRQKKFCSRECIDQHARDNTVRKGTCEECGKDFLKDRPDTKYCSIACRDKAASCVKEYICLTCGVHFSRKSANSKDYKYCSVSCSSITNNATRVLKRNIHPIDVAAPSVEKEAE